MAVRRPLVIVNGQPAEMPAGDIIPFAVNRSAAMAKLAADLTNQNFQFTAVPWAGANVYDDAAWHSPATNNTRLTVPAGIDRVKVGYALQFANVGPGSNLYALVKKNGASVPGSPDFVDNANVQNPRISCQSGALLTASGDYFELLLYSSDTSVDLLAETSAFWIEAT